MQNFEVPQIQGCQSPQTGNPKDKTEKKDKAQETGNPKDKTEKNDKADPIYYICCQGQMQRGQCTVVHW